MDANPQSPAQEAISVITIAAVLVAVGCYVAALKNVPVLAPCLFWVALQVYQLFPALRDVPGSQVPMLTGAAAVGIFFFICTIPLAYWLATAFSRQGIQTLERQSLRLKRHRERLKKRSRDADDFLVG